MEQGKVTTTNELIKLTFEYVESEFNKVCRPGFKFLGSMNFADTWHTNRNDFEWLLAERFYYLKLADYQITIDRDGYIIKFERIN